MKLKILTDDGRYAQFELDDDLINLHKTTADKAKFIAHQCEKYILAMLELKPEDKDG